MKFILEVDMSELVRDDDAGKELGRILRYWGGAVQQVELKPGQRQALYDSAYREVGHWVVTDSQDAA